MKYRIMEKRDGHPKFALSTYASVRQRIILNAFEDGARPRGGLLPTTYDLPPRFRAPRTAPPLGERASPVVADWHALIQQIARVQS